jgi:hypothetical protein
MMKIFVAMPLGKKEVPGIRKSVRRAADVAGVLCIFPDEIEKTGHITNQIIEEIRTCSAMIVEITNRNPNVIWEYGFASAVGKPIIPIAQTAKALFFDTKDVRSIIYEAKRIDLTLTQKLCERLSELKTTNASFPFVDLVGTRVYPDASSVMALKGISTSGFGIFDLMKIAKKWMLIAAQNHMFIVREMEKFQSALEKFLKTAERFDILMCDPSADYAVKAWQYVTEEKHRDHLSEASTAFDRLASWAGSKSFGKKLRIRKIPFVPASINFVDPDDKDGFLVMTPNVFESQNRSRPCFIVSRVNNDDVFQHYWRSYSHKFDE